MHSARKSHHVLYVALVFALLLGLAIPSQTAQAATSTIYDAIPATLPSSMASLGFQATQTAEFGDHIHLGGTDRALSEVTVTMVTWAKYSDWSSMSAAGWTHPITLNIYNVEPTTPGYPGTLITTNTQTFDIPWRPPDDTTNCTGTDAGKWWDGSQCNNGYAFNITFDLSSLGTVLPDEIIVGIAYNTQTWGYAPIGASGPYNSLNVGAQGTIAIGSDDNTDNVYWNTETAAWYTDGGAGGVGIFREDTKWTPYGTLPIEIVANDGVYPTTVASTPANNAVLTSGPTQLSWTFSEDVVHDASSIAADNVINYLLFEDGADDTFNTVNCAGGISASDTAIAINSAVYNTGTFTATLGINGGVALPAGSYRLLACGTTSIEDLDGYTLNNGVDSVLNFSVSEPVSATELPDTGFPMGRVSSLPEQPTSKAYSSTEMTLNIPKLGLSMPIVGVPVTEGEWDVSWLGSNAGWLNGSAFPTWAGNTVLTAHVWDAWNQPGPFAQLKTLKYGDQFTISAYGQVYTYEVSESKVYWAGSAASKVFQHEELDWVTLLTCETYNPLNGGYFFRRAVRAVLISIQ